MYTKINENGKRLQCRKKSITSDGFCSLHYEFSNDARVAESSELGLAAYDVLADEDMEESENNNREQLTTQSQRKEVRVQLTS